MDGGVFHSIHEHLATMIDIKNSNEEEGHDENHACLDDEDVEGEYNMPRITLCISLILESIVVLVKSKKLTDTKGGRYLLQAVLNQLAHGKKHNKTLTGTINTPTPTQRRGDGSAEIMKGE